MGPRAFPLNPVTYLNPPIHLLKRQAPAAVHRLPPSPLATSLAESPTQEIQWAVPVWSSNRCLSVTSIRPATPFFHQLATFTNYQPFTNSFLLHHCSPSPETMLRFGLSLSSSEYILGRVFIPNWHVSTSQDKLWTRLLQRSLHSQLSKVRQPHMAA